MLLFGVEGGGCLRAWFLLRFLQPQEIGLDKVILQGHSAGPVDLGAGQLVGPIVCTARPVRGSCPRGYRSHECSCADQIVQLRWEHWLEIFPLEKRD